MQMNDKFLLLYICLSLQTYACHISAFYYIHSSRFLIRLLLELKYPHEAGIPTYFFILNLKCVDDKAKKMCKANKVGPQYKLKLSKLKLNI